MTDFKIENPYDFTLVPEGSFGPEMSSKSTRGVVFMFHGFDWLKNKDPGTAFQPAADYVRSELSKDGIDVHYLRYNTHESFVYAAKIWTDQIKNAAPNLPKVHFFGYSMGGLVARQIAANGISPTSLFTFCTPNLGTANWVPPVNNGALSMAGYSNDLKMLNNNTYDKSNRSRMTCIGYAYRENSSKTHNNDGVVELSSAVMWNTNPAPNQKMWLSPRIGSQWPLEPHGNLQSFPDVRPSLDLFIDTVRTS